MVDKLEIIYSPPEFVTNKKMNELIININNPEVLMKSINLSLEIEVFSASLKTDLKELILGKNNLNISFT